MRIWDPNTGNHLRTLTGHHGWVFSVAIGTAAHRDIIATSSYDHRVRIWDAATGEHLRSLSGHDDEVIAVAIGRSGDHDLIVSGSSDRTVMAYEYRALTRPCNRTTTSRWHTGLRAAARSAWTR